MSTKTYIQYDIGTDNVRCAVVHKAYNGQRYCFPTMRFVELKPHELTKDFLESYREGPPTTEILQSILDAAWEFGLRPTGFTDIKNETAAIKYHLEDMRKLVFKGR